MSAVADIIDLLQAWHWLALGLALVLTALVAGKRPLWWFAAGAWLTGLMMLFFPLAIAGQAAIFAAVTFAVAVGDRLALKSGAGGQN